VFKLRGVLPGFGLTFGYVVFYLGFLVILPLSALGVKASGLTLAQFVSVVTDERALHAYGISFGCALLAAVVNAVGGLLCAWTR
jgi:sulfate/thiosulfate transport system permease protein